MLIRKTWNITISIIRHFTLSSFPNNAFVLKTFVQTDDGIMSSNTFCGVFIGGMFLLVLLVQIHRDLSNMGRLL